MVSAFRLCDGGSDTTQSHDGYRGLRRRVRRAGSSAFLSCASAHQRFPEKRRGEKARSPQLKVTRLNWGLRNNGFGSESKQKGGTPAVQQGTLLLHRQPPSSCHHNTRQKLRTACSFPVACACVSKKNAVPVSYHHTSGGGVPTFIHSFRAAASRAVIRPAVPNAHYETQAASQPASRQSRACQG